MLVMFLVVLGVFSFLNLGVDLFPRTDPATVYVRVALPGASPEEVTSQVVMPLEEAIASVSGIDEMRAMVSEGTASIIVTFVLERDIGEASEDVREKVAGAMRALPPNVLPPVVQKADPDSDPIIMLVISGQRSTRELTEIADKQVRRALETVDGVAGVDITGGLLRQINVFLDLDKLSGYNLTAQDVERALKTENVETPGGHIIRGPTEIGVRTLGRVEEVPEFNNIIVKNAGDAPGSCPGHRARRGRHGGKAQFCVLQGQAGGRDLGAAPDRHQYRRGSGRDQNPSGISAQRTALRREGGRDQGSGHLHQGLGGGARGAPGAWAAFWPPSSSGSSSGTGARC